MVTSFVWDVSPFSVPLGVENIDDKLMRMGHLLSVFEHSVIGHTAKSVTNTSGEISSDSIKLISKYGSTNAFSETTILLITHISSDGPEVAALANKSQNHGSTERRTRN